MANFKELTEVLKKRCPYTSLYINVPCSREISLKKDKKIKCHLLVFKWIA